MKLSELLTDESKWTKGAFARTKSGVGLWNGSSPNAVCWCLSGALQVCDARSETKQKIREHLKIDFIPAWNDAPERTFDDVKNLLTELNL